MRLELELSSEYPYKFPIRITVAEAVSFIVIFRCCISQAAIQHGLSDKVVQVMKNAAKAVAQQCAQHGEEAIFQIYTEVREKLDKCNSMPSASFHEEMLARQQANQAKQEVGPKSQSCFSPHTSAILV